MSALRSFNYTIRLDIQRGYGTSQLVKEEDVLALKQAFETRLKNMAEYFSNLASVIWLEEVKAKPMPEPLSPIL